MSLVSHCLERGNIKFCHGKDVILLMGEYLVATTGDYSSLGFVLNPLFGSPRFMIKANEAIVNELITHFDNIGGYTKMIINGVGENDATIVVKVIYLGGFSYLKTADNVDKKLLDALRNIIFDITHTPINILQTGILYNEERCLVLCEGALVVVESHYELSLLHEKKDFIVIVFRDIIVGDDIRKLFQKMRLAELAVTLDPDLAIRVLAN
jgi:hypothetical protein